MLLFWVQSVSYTLIKPITSVIGPDLLSYSPLPPLFWGLYEGGEKEVYPIGTEAIRGGLDKTYNYRGWAI
jgi:hypothetical protein